MNENNTKSDIYFNKSTVNFQLHTLECYLNFSNIDLGCFFCDSELGTKLVKSA